jgi:mannose-6-phosphate isomerase
MLYPLTFEPIFKERIWGGEEIGKLYGKTPPSGQAGTDLRGGLSPGGSKRSEISTRSGKGSDTQPSPIAGDSRGEQSLPAPIGESWEISDRPGDSSVVKNGRFKGKTLEWLMHHHRTELLGSATNHERFPLLIKILDAREILSLQVHPPAEKAAELGGEPKTEMWHVVQARPGAELFAGLKRGVTREEFAAKIRDGTVAECFHRISVTPGDTMFLPSGRVHALGAGLVIFEIQQNSDTTYRVFDWNRKDNHGKPRELHVEKSLASIDFSDFEPGLVVPKITDEGDLRRKELVNNSLFQVDILDASKDSQMIRKGNELTIFGVIRGSMSCTFETESLKIQAGHFLMLPAQCSVFKAEISNGAQVLEIRTGSA